MAKSSRSDREQEMDQLLRTLDQFEDLLEYMDELGVDTRAEAEARMRELNQRIDELEAELDGG
jgi:hypothetical protein